jgi:hypothetical protein
MEEGQTIPWQKEKGQKNKQRSTKNYTENSALSNTNPTKKGIELMSPGRVSSSCPTSGTHRVSLFTNHVISHE